MGDQIAKTKSAGFKRFYRGVDGKKNGIVTCVELS